MKLILYEMLCENLHVKEVTIDLDEHQTVLNGDLLSSVARENVGSSYLMKMLSIPGVTCRISGSDALFICDGMNFKANDTCNVAKNAFGKYTYVASLLLQKKSSLRRECLVPWAIL